MSENGEKCWSLFPKAQGDIVECLVSSTAQRESVYFHRGLKKLENICIWEADCGKWVIVSGDSSNQTLKSVHRMPGGNQGVPST